MPTDRLPRRRWWRLPIAAAILLLAYALAGFVGLPWLLRTLAQEQAGRLGRQLQIGAIRVNPFTFELGIDALKLSEADGQPLVALDALYVDLDLLHSILERGAVLSAVRCDAPDIALLIDAGGSLNWKRLLPPSADSAEPPSALPALRVTELSIARGRLWFEDRSRPETFSSVISPIAFTLQDFRTAPAHRNRYQFSAAASSGETLSWSGDFSLQPLTSQGHFVLGKLQAATLTRFLQQPLPVHLVSGSGELSGDYQLSLADAPSLELRIPKISLYRLALAEAGEAAPTLSIAELSLLGLDVSLGQRAVKLQRIEINQLKADAQRAADGSLNLSRLYTPPAASGSPAGPQWSVAVQRVDLIDNDIRVSDHSVEPALQLSLSPLNASLRNVSSDLSAALQIELSGTLGRSGKLRALGDVVPQPLSANLALDASGIDLTVLQPYVAMHSGVALQSGLLSAKGKLRYAQPPAPADAQIAFDGSAALSQLDVQDRALKQELLKWRELRVAGIDYRSMPARLSIERIDLLAPETRVTISATREINIATALAAPGSAPPTPAPDAADKASVTQKTSPALPWTIGRIHVEEGQMQFTDRSIDPNFSAGIFALAGDISALGSDAAVRATIELAGKVDEFAPVLISGELTPSQFDRYSDLKLSFHNMDLVRFNPYSGRFAGYNIVKGKLSTELHYQIRDRELAAEHHVILDQLEFGDATGSKDAVPLPIKLAAALLKDRHGVIDLALPVRGSLDDPAFDIGAMVGKVLGNLLVKAVSAPFTALASLFGGNGEELAYVSFAAGSAELGEAERRKLDQLANALIERPELKLDIPLAALDSEDGAALARQQLLGPIAADADARQRLKALEQQHRQLLGADPDYSALSPEPNADDKLAARTAFVEAALIPKLKPDAEQLKRLAIDRARQVQAAILAHGEIQPERLFLTARESASSGSDGDVRMQLSLQ
ncbi:DUF748 domain-containing protein [Hydrocarboniphaga sp.]|uniref:DUF748 domain-containing protein n=1 Tax=Hydrocarboniphaga sp. TaxID=2033016 RepID=UPI003D0F09DB